MRQKLIILTPESTFMGRELELIEEERVFTVDIAATARRYLENPDEATYATVENPDLESELEEVSGKAFLRGPESPELIQEFDDTWEYLNARIETEEMQEIGVINPFGNGKVPRTFVIAYLDDEGGFETDKGLTDYLNIVEISYDEGWDESRIFAEQYSPEEMIRK